MKRRERATAIVPTSNASRSLEASFPPRERMLPPKPPPPRVVVHVVKEDKNQISLRPTKNNEHHEIEDHFSDHEHAGIWDHVQNAREHHHEDGVMLHAAAPGIGALSIPAPVIMEGPSTSTKAFQSLSRRAAASMHTGRLVAARALPLLVAEDGFRQVKMALEHARGQDGGRSLPSEYQTSVHAAQEYIEHTQAKAILDLCNAIKNTPPLPQQFERLGRALERANDLGFGTGDVATVGESTVEGNSIKELMTSADHLHDRLKLLWEMRQMVEIMDQRTVAEIKSFKQPLPEIEAVMRTTLVLLGTKRKEINTWKECLASIGKLGRESLKRRIREFIIQTVKPDQLQYALRSLRDIEVDRIVNVSQGTTIFYRWCNAVMSAIVDEQNVEDGVFQRAGGAVAKLMQPEESFSEKELQTTLPEHTQHKEGCLGEGGQLERVKDSRKQRKLHLLDNKPH